MIIKNKLRFKVRLHKKFKYLLLSKNTIDNLLVWTFNLKTITTEQRYFTIKILKKLNIRGLKHKLKIMIKILKYLKGLIFGFNKQDKQAILDAIEITNGIKNYIENPSADAFVAVTKNKLDDWVLRILRVQIPRILHSLNLCLLIDVNNGEAIKVASSNLQKIETPFKGDMLDAIACNLVPILSNDRISWDIAKQVVKPMYDELKK